MLTVLKGTLIGYRWTLSAKEINKDISFFHKVCNKFIIN